LHFCEFRAFWGRLWNPILVKGQITRRAGETFLADLVL
jgi:hypothetical protein